MHCYLPGNKAGLVAANAPRHVELRSHAQHAVGGPERLRALASLLTDASAIIWRYHARMLWEGFLRCDARARATLDAPTALDRVSG